MANDKGSNVKREDSGSSNYVVPFFFLLGGLACSQISASTHGRRQIWIKPAKTNMKRGGRHGSLFSRPPPPPFRWHPANPTMTPIEKPN